MQLTIKAVAGGFIALDEDGDEVGSGETAEEAVGQAVCAEYLRDGCAEVQAISGLDD